MIYFVTGNDKKWAEIEAILGDSIEIKRSNIDCIVKIIYAYQFINSPPLFCLVPELQGATLEEIATKKVEAAHSLLSAPVIIEDTALCFKSLNGLPGAYVKWFLEAVGPEGLCRMLDGFGETAEAREAEAVCTMAYHEYF